MNVFLETKRLLLKPTELSDFNNLEKLYAEPEVRQHLAYVHSLIDKDLKKLLARSISYQEKHGFGLCSVFLKEGGTFVGQAGLFHLDFQDMQPEIELTICLAKQFWDNGYATELARALIEWGFKNLSIHRIIARIDHHQNSRSRHFLEKASMTYTAKINHRNQVITCYEIYKKDGIEVVPYNSQWPQLALAEINLLTEILPKQHILDIQHVGSTSIPGINAKPIIDIQIGVDSLMAIRQTAIDILKHHDYVYWEENTVPDRMFFVKGVPPFGEKRTHHLYIVEIGSNYWYEKILFRDYLRTHSQTARQYENLKHELAQRHTYNRDQYRNEKTSFVSEILTLAKEELLSVKQKPYIVFISGASGAGKTTLVNALKQELSDNDIICLYFDQIGVPAESEMIKIYGSGSEWQKAMTYHWVKNLTKNYQDKNFIIFEGQVNLDFIEAAFKGFNFHAYKILLLHCNRHERHKRLQYQRQQLELINDEMDNWADFLKNQATEKKVTIIDTTMMSTDDIVDWFKAEILSLSSI